MTTCTTFNCICIPAGSDDCQLLSWNNTTLQAEWSGRPSALSILNYYKDDCVSVYDCGDICLQWGAVIGANAYRILENNSIIADNITATTYTISSTGGGNRTFTVIPLSCAGLTGDGLNVTVNDTNCTSTCFTLSASLACFKTWAGTPFNWGSDCDPTQMSANFNLPTGAFTYTITSSLYGTLPQNAGATWVHELYIDSLYAGNVGPSFVLTDPADVSPTGSLSGSVSSGMHLFELRLRQTGGAPGYPNTQIEQKQVTIEICPF